MLRRFIYSLAAVCLMGSVAMAQVAVTTPLYVDAATGNDADDGLTPANAKATVAGALAALSGNDGILVAAGTYQENNLLINGIVLQGGWDSTFTTYNPSANVTILDGGYTGAGTGARILEIGGANLTLQGLTLQNANSLAANGGAIFHESGQGSPNLTGTTLIHTCRFVGNVAQANDGAVAFIRANTDNITWQDCVFENNGTGGDDTLIRADVGSGETLTFDNCTFTNNALDRRLIFNDNGGNTTITGCTFTSNSTSGDELITCRRVTGTVSITGCTFEDNHGFFFGMDDVNAMTGALVVEQNVLTSNSIEVLFSMTNDSTINTGSNTYFIDNRLSDNTFGTQIAAGDKTLMGNEIAIVNNVFHNNTGADALLNLENETAAGTVVAVVQNNIFSDNSGFANGMLHSSQPTNGSWTVVSNNVFFNSAPGTTDGTTAVALDGRLTGNGNFTQDPLFVDAANGNFHLQTSPESPAANAGFDLSAAAYDSDTDIDGDARPFGTGYDIGVDESNIVPVELSDFSIE